MEKPCVNEHGNIDVWFRVIFGAARENRTPDPIITNDVLYQLSYCGITP
jgi:hypothetical protein